MEMSRVMEWTEGKVIALIEEYRSHPALWDSKSANFKIRDRRNDAWNEMAARLNIPRTEIERKIKVILAQYRRERQKSDRMKKSVMASEEINASMWFAFKNLSFLCERRQAADSRRSIHEKVNGKEQLSEIGERVKIVTAAEARAMTAEKDIRAKEDMCESMKKFDSLNHFAWSNSAMRRIATKTDDKKLTETCITATSAAERRQCRDEYTIFGEQVACKLKKLDDRSRLILQHKINTIIFEAEMDMLQKNNPEITQQSATLWNPVSSWVPAQSIPIANVVHTYTTSATCSTPTISPPSESITVQANISQINYTTPLNTVQSSPTDGSYNF